MEHIQVEKYASGNRDFVITTYKDNNNDTIIIKTKEVTNGDDVDLPYTGKVPMKGQWNLSLEEYESFHDQLAAVKQSIIIYTHADIA